MKLLLTHPLPPSERRCLSVDQVDGGGASPLQMIPEVRDDAL